MDLQEAFAEFWMNSSWPQPWPRCDDVRVAFYAGAAYGLKTAEAALDESFEEVQKELTTPPEGV